MKVAFVTTAALLLGACGPEPLAQSGAGTTTVAIGQKLDFKLQTIGPGEYASPPTVSSRVVQFLGAAFVGPAVPAGPTQRFSFRAMERGLAIIVFHHTGQSPTVEDTVYVR